MLTMQSFSNLNTNKEPVFPHPHTHKTSAGIMCVQGRIRSGGRTCVYLNKFTQKKQWQYNHESAHLYMLYGLVDGTGLQQSHSASTKSPTCHPAPIHTVHLHGCRHKLIQLFAAHLIQISKRKLKVRAHSLVIYGSDVHQLLEPYLSELWLSTISFPNFT